MMTPASFGQGAIMGLVIGLDAHLKTCVYKVKDEYGTLVGEGTIPSTPTDLSALAETYPGSTVVVEASSVTEWIHDCLTDRGLEVFVCHPENLRRGGRKSDELDAGHLADAFRVGALTRAYVPPREIRTLRQLARRAAFLTRERTRFKNRVHAILQRRGVRLLDDVTDEDAPNVFALKRRDRLLAVGDPEIPVLLDLIDAVEEKRRALDRELEGVARSNEDVRNLTTIPGFGPLVAVCVYAEVGDVSRFPDAESLSAYFGLVPMESQSGETRVRGHITRRGPSYVRWLLNQASWQHVRLCPQSSVGKDHKRLARRLGKKRAITSVGRRLVKVSYWILRERRPFTLNGFDQRRASTAYPARRDPSRAA